jgi:hypothetical protein
LKKENGKRAEWEYPFAVAGLNLSFMLAQMLDLRAGSTTKILCSLTITLTLSLTYPSFPYAFYAELPKASAGRKFVELHGGSILDSIFVSLSHRLP